MALSLNKFECFVEDLAEGKHDFGTHTFKLALTASLPLASYNELADITEIANGGGYTTGGTAVTLTSSSQTGGVYKYVIGNVVFTGGSGDMAPWRYIVLYNDTASGDPLIGWYDYGSNLTLLVGDTFTAVFDPTNGALQIT